MKLGDRFTLYNGSGVWGWYDGTVTEVVDGCVLYVLVNRNDKSESQMSSRLEHFMKNIEDGYIVMKEVNHESQ